MSDRDKNIYFAKLEEQAERYDEMADHMKKVGKAGDKLSVEERNLLSLPTRTRSAVMIRKRWPSMLAWLTSRLRRSPRRTWP